ncbi:MAG TPA: hypothetical protein VGF42_00660 [Caulobacteraceae bacterium]|jgi:hypothetical protein
MTETTQTVRDRIVGAWETPVNRWQAAPNSIHNDQVARRIGMRGGTIPGTVHLSWFRPILDELFGGAWLRRGGVSMFYTYATLNGEQVRAIVDAPDRRDDVQVDAIIENENGKTVAKGTLFCGSPDAVSYIRGLPLEPAPREALRILEGMQVGMPTPDREAYVVDKGGEAGELRDPQEMYRALAVFPEGVDLGGAVGFFGATEIRLHAGPIQLGTPYRKTGQVICVGASPKTEFAWFDSWLHDGAGELIAEMRHMTRWMKASSKRWSEA